MNEVCPVCAEVLSEINGANGTGYSSLEELPWRDFVLISPLLSAMFMPEAIQHVADRKHHIAAGFSDPSDYCRFFTARLSRSGRSKAWLAMYGVDEDQE